MSRRMLHIPVEGPTRLVDADTLDQMRATIGCDWVERVSLTPAILHRRGNGIALIVDEEGLIGGKPANPRASDMYGTRAHGHPICGDALLAWEAAGPDGIDFVDLPVDLIARFCAVYGIEVTP